MKTLNVGMCIYCIIANHISVTCFRFDKMGSINSKLRINRFENQKDNGRIRYRGTNNKFKVNSLEDGDSTHPAQKNEAVGTEEVKDQFPQSDGKSKFYIDKSIIYTIPHDDYVVIGKILTTYGLKGHVKVKSYTSKPEIRLCEPGYRYLKIPYNDEKVIPIKLQRGRNSGLKEVYIVKFEGFDSVEQSQRLSNTYITVPLAQMPPLEEDTYYSRDLIGLDLYLYNDINKTKLGKIVGFVHHTDLASRKKFEEVCDDLIDVQVDMKVSLQTLIDVSNSAKASRENEESERRDIKQPTIVTESELDNADEVVDMYEEFQTPNFKSIVYVKYYECSICHKEFTNHTLALLHERIHEVTSNNKSGVEQEAVEVGDEGREGEVVEGSEESDSKLKVVSIEEIIESQIKKPLRRFYVPLVRNETVKYIDVENKSVYVDPYTIFIGEDPNYK